MNLAGVGAGVEWDVHDAVEARLAELAKTRELPPVAIVVSGAEMASASGEQVILNVADRTYVKRGTEQERRLLRSLLPDAKFLPVPAT